MADKQEVKRLLVKHLEKKDEPVRFTDAYKQLDLITTCDMPYKSAFSSWCNDWADDGSISSWNEKGARWLYTPIDMEHLKHDVYKTIDRIWVQKSKIPPDDIYDALSYPSSKIDQALIILTNEGQIQNTTVDGNIYYRLPPLHPSIKIAIALSILVGAIHIVGVESIDKSYLGALTFIVVWVMALLWYKIR